MFTFSRPEATFIGDLTLMEEGEGPPRKLLAPYNQATPRNVFSLIFCAITLQLL